MNNNNTTTSDNSSDSASNTKKNTKSEIEIIDQKIIKCFNEINSLKQKIQREWSKQMNTHLKNFYDEETDSANKSSNNNDSIASNASTSFSTPLQNESSDHDKRIYKLHQKLKSYEKRRQKLLYDSKKEQENANQTNQTDNLNELKSDSNSSSSNAINTLTNATNLANNLNITPSLGIVTNPNLTSINNLQAKLSNRSDSFVINATNQFVKSTISDDLSNLKANLIDEKNPSFYLNTDTNLSNMKFNNSDTGGNYQMTEDHNSHQICLEILRQLMDLKIQQDKIQSEMEEMREKSNENHQALLKEIQNTSHQMSDQICKTVYGSYKTHEQKLEDMKSTFEHSIKSFSYNLNHCHRDVKDAKEDVSLIKSKIDIMEKGQKIPNIETTPTNYYQLFYKLLDILLTLATIILLAFQNVTSSIKFVFLLYPRTIVVFLFIYFIFVYIIDYDRLKIYDDLGYLNEEKLNSTNSFTKALNTIYGLMFILKNRLFSEQTNQS